MTGNGTLIVHMPVQHATTAPPRHTNASMDKTPLTLQVSLFINIEIEMRDVNKLIHVAYKKMLQCPEKYAWIRHIKDLLCCHGFGYIWNDQAVANERAFINLFEQRIRDEFIQKCFTDNQTATDEDYIKKLKSYVAMNVR